MFLEELSFSKITRIRTGAFSAALSADQQLFIWGKGVFGEFYTPHRVKSVNKLDILDFEISAGGSAFILTRQGTLYGWGDNSAGQLGLGDYENRSTPERIDALEGKRVTSVTCGSHFVVALGLTMPQREYEMMAKKNKVVPKKPHSQISTNSKSSKSRSKHRSKSQGKRLNNNNSAVTDLNRTTYSSSKALA